MSKLEAYLDAVAKTEASDLHLRVGVRPRYRVDGELVDMAEFDIITYEAMNQAGRRACSPRPRSRATNSYRRSISHSGYKNASASAPTSSKTTGDPRFRCVAFRSTIPTLEDLQPSEPRSRTLAHLRRGLVLVTGATGSGKVIDAGGDDRHHQQAPTRSTSSFWKIPIEYLHSSQRSVIHQRAMHMDFTTFSSGLEDALRQDPDVLLVGELRDLESIRLALTAAEMGMVVYSTLHTLGAAQSIDRIYDVFPAAEQPEIRTMLAHSLEGVVSQVLLKRMDGAGRLPATEVLISSSGVRNLIREGKTQEITNYIQSGKSQGMQTLSDSLESLIKQRKIDPEEALYYTGKRDRLEKMLQAQMT